MECSFELIIKGHWEFEEFSSENAAVARARELFPNCAIEPFVPYGNVLKGAWGRPVYLSANCIGDEEKRVAWIVGTRI